MIILSVGHDEERQGAKHLGISEWMLATNLVKFIDHPDIVVIDRTLEETVMVINDWPGPVDLAVEMHFNSHPTALGCETLYCPGSIPGKAAAEAFQTAYVAGYFFVRDRGVKEGWYKMKPNTFIDHFLRATSCPALILEPEFIQSACTWDAGIMKVVARYITEALLEARRSL
jgi:hypothetical protein